MIPRIMSVFILILLCLSTVSSSTPLNVLSSPVLSNKNSLSSVPDGDGEFSTAAPTIAPTTLSFSIDNSRKGSDDDFIQFHRTDYSLLYLFNFIFAGTNLILLITTTYALFSADLYNNFLDGYYVHNNNNLKDSTNKVEDKYGVIQFNSVVPINEAPSPSSNHKRIIVKRIEDHHDETNLNPLEDSDDFLDFELIAESIQQADIEEAQRQSQQQTQNQTPNNRQISLLRQPLFDCFGLLIDRRPHDAMLPQQLQQLQQRFHRHRRSRFSILPLRQQPHHMNRQNLPQAAAPPAVAEPLPNRIMYRLYSIRWAYYMNSIAFLLFGWHFGLASFGLNSLGTKYYAANIIITNIISIIALLLCVFHLLYRRVIFIFFTFCIVVAFISTSMIIYFDK